MGTKIYSGLMTAQQHREQRQRDEQLRRSEEAERQRRELKDRIRQKSAPQNPDGEQVAQLNRQLRAEQTRRAQVEATLARTRQQQRQPSYLQYEIQRRQNLINALENLLGEN
jgi:hypothetical protein